MCLEAGFSIFKIWCVWRVKALLGRFRGVRSGPFHASLLHLHWSGAKHSPENSLKSALRGIWALQRVCMVRGRNLKIYQARARKTPKSRTYALIILYQSVTIRPKWCTTLKLWGWTQEQNFHGIGVPGGRFFNFQNLGCGRVPSIAGKVSRCAE